MGAEADLAFIATYASLDQAVQLVGITVQELGQISSLVEDLDSRVADQYSLTDVQIDDVSARVALCRRVAHPGSL